MEEEERRYITNITIKVLAVLVSDGVNENDKIIKTFENPVEIKFSKEFITLSKEEIASPNEIIIPAANAATQISSNVAIKKVFLIGNNDDHYYQVTHNLNSRDIYVSVRENFGPDYSVVTVSIDYSDPNHIHIDMGGAIPNDSYVVTIIG
jgi:hypothetical protein